MTTTAPAVVQDRERFGTQRTAVRNRRPRTWRDGDFIKLWVGETVSLFGSQVTELALPLTAILTLQATPAQIGLLNAAKFIPFLLVSLVAGVWVDRRRRRSLLIGSNLGRAALLGLVPLFAVLHMLNMWQLYAIAVLTGVLTVVFDLAYLSYLPSLVERDQLADRNSKLQASASLAAVGGPGAGGMLVGVLTAPVALIVDASSYLVSAASLVSIKRREPRPDHPLERSQLGKEVREGLRLVFRDVRLRALAGQAATFNLFEDFILTVFILYATRALHMRPAALGLVFAAGGAGAVVGSLGGGWAARVVGLGPALLVSMTAACLAPCAFLFAHDAGPLAIGILSVSFFIHGAGVAIGNVNVVTLRQSLTPDGLLGRMNASYRLLTYGAIPLGSFLGGLLGSLLGLRPALVVGVLGLPSALLWVLFSPVRKLRAVPGSEASVSDIHHVEDFAMVTNPAQLGPEE